MLEATELSAESQAKLEELAISASEFFALVDRLNRDVEALLLKQASLESRLDAAEIKLASR